MLNNIYCPIYGGGVFSKIMLMLQIIEYNVGDLSSIENIYVKNLDNRIDVNLNPFDFIYEQEIKDSQRILNYHTFPSFQNWIPMHYLERFRIILSKLKHQSALIERFNNIAKELKFKNNMLGVHLRLTDMNTLHGDAYGNKSFEDYVKAIDLFLKTNEVEQIYVAADNNESLNKLIDIYGNKIVYYKGFIRPDSENATVNFQLDNFSDKALWEDSFVDMCLLAQCETMIHRVSNFANAAKVYSNNIKKTILI